MCHPNASWFHILIHTHIIAVSTFATTNVLLDHLTILVNSSTLSAKTI